MNSVNKKMNKQEAIDYGRNWYKAIESRGDSSESDALTFLSWAILSLSEHKEGKWVEDIDFGGESRWYCSCCNTKGWKYNNYCCECGAKMTSIEEFKSPIIV